MLSLFVRLIQYVSHAIRHRILGYAHPLPRSMRVYPGETGSIYRAIVTDLLDVCSFPQLEVVETPERNRPTLWIDDEPPVAGCMTVCRYLGRQWRILPVNPTTCATVDSSIELLQAFLHPFVAETFTESIHMCDHVAVFATMLEISLESVPYTRHLNGFESNTLADVCWAAAWTHLLDVEGISIPAPEYPRLHAWMKHQGILYDDDATSDETTSDETTDDDLEDADEVEETTVEETTVEETTVEEKKEQ